LNKPGTLKSIFTESSKAREITVIGYLPAGFPDRDSFRGCVSLLSQSGIHIIEIGIPDLSPNMDGQVIADAVQETLKQGVTVDEAISLGGDAIENSRIAGVAMLYYSTLEENGRGRILSALKKNGFCGILVPDAPLKEIGAFSRSASDSGLQTVGFIPARAKDEEIEVIVAGTTGFIYVQSYQGTTGEQFRANEELIRRLEKIKMLASSGKLPVAVGFGIHTNNDLKALHYAGVDGAIVGSAMVEAAGKGMEMFVRFLTGLLSDKGE